MAGMRDLKRRIKSVQSTRKITRAMQMVSAAKMRKAQNATLASRTYSALAWELIMDLSKFPAEDIPLLQSNPKASKIGIILISSNRGFVGSLNTNLSHPIKQISATDPDVLMEIISYGKNAKTLAVKMGKKITADFPKTDATIHTFDIFPLAKLIMDNFTKGEYKKIYLVYNHFVSTLTQKATFKQLLPFPEQDMMAVDKKAKAAKKSDYLFEPNPEQVLEHLLPRIVESQIYQAILESDASEHSARMVMMKNATEAAGDLIDDLTLTYNQMRQNKITTELSEITAGKIALE